MTLRGKNNHYNVKLLKGYGVSINLKDNRLCLKGGRDPLAGEQETEERFVSQIPTSESSFLVASYDGKNRFPVRAFVMLSLLFKLDVYNYCSSIMITRVKLRAWGNSLGAIIPKEIVNQAGLKEGEEVEISVRPVTNVRRLFGKYPTGDAQEAKDEMRAGWRDNDDTNE